MTLASRLAILLLAGAAAASAQPRSVEVFATTGYAWYAEDRGYHGSGANVGAIVSLPLGRHFAFEPEVQTGRSHFRSRWPQSVVRYPDYSSRITTYGVSASCRLGKERLYGLFGGGPTLFTYRERYAGLLLHLRGGMVYNPYKNLVVRIDVMGGLSSGMALGGVKLGVGYRFR